MTKASLPKHCLLTKPWQYKHVYSHGKRLHGSYFTFIFTTNELLHDRLGISISGKKLAIKRNRIKRLIKEFYRLNRMFPSCISQKDNGICVDLVVATNKKFEPHGLSDIYEAFSRFLQHAPHLKQPETDTNSSFT